MTVSGEEQLGHRAMVAEWVSSFDRVAWWCRPRAPVVPSKKVFEVGARRLQIPSEEVRLEP